MAVRDADTLQYSFSTERVNVRTVDDWRGPRAIVVAEHVFEVRWIVAGPQVGAGFGVETQEPRAVFDSGELKKFAVADCWRGIAGADGFLPDDWRAFWRPGGWQS